MMTDDECRIYLSEIYNKYGIKGLVKNNEKIPKCWFSKNIHNVPERLQYEKDNGTGSCAGVPSPWCCKIIGKTEERNRILKDTVLQQNTTEELLQKLGETKHIFTEKQTPFEQITVGKLRETSHRAYSIYLVLTARDKVGFGTISKALGYYGCQEMTDEECKICLNEIYLKHGLHGLRGDRLSGKIRQGWFNNNIYRVPSRHKYEADNRVRSRETSIPSAWCCYIIGKTEERTRFIKDNVLQHNTREELLQKLREMKPIFVEKQMEIDVLTVEKLREISPRAYSIHLVLMDRDKVSMDDIREILGFQRSWYKYDDSDICKNYLEDIFEREGIDGLIPKNFKNGWYGNNIQGNKRKPERFQIDNAKQIRGHSGCPSYWCCDLIDKLKERDEFIKKTNLKANTTQELLQKLLNYKGQIYSEMPSQIDWDQLKKLNGRIPELYCIVLLLMKREKPIEPDTSNGTSDSGSESFLNSRTSKIDIAYIRRLLGYMPVGYVTSDVKFRLDSLPEYNFYEVIVRKFDIDFIGRSEKYGAILNDTSMKTYSKYLKYETDFTIKYTNTDGQKVTLIVEIWGNQIDENGHSRVSNNGRTSSQKYLIKRKIKEEMGQKLKNGMSFTGIEHTICYKPEEIEILLRNKMKMKYKNESQITTRRFDSFNTYYTTNERNVCKTHIENCLLRKPESELSDFPPHVGYIIKQCGGLDNLKKQLFRKPKSKEDLKKECRALKLKVTGNVGVLLRRLENPKEGDYFNCDGFTIKERTPGRWSLYHRNSRKYKTNSRRTLGIYDSHEEAEKEKQNFITRGCVSEIEMDELMGIKIVNEKYSARYGSVHLGVWDTIEDAKIARETFKDNGEKIYLRTKKSGSICRIETKDCFRYSARLNQNGITINLGSWDSEDDAQKAIDIFIKEGTILKENRASGCIKERKDGKFVAYKTTKKKTKNIGVYDTKHDAQKVIDDYTKSTKIK